MGTRLLKLLKFFFIFIIGIFLLEEMNKTMRANMEVKLHHYEWQALKQDEVF